MTEQALNKLFEKARNEALETSVQDVRKWIGLVTVGALVLSVLAKLKFVLTNKLGIMLASTILTTGSALVVYVAVVSGDGLVNKQLNQTHYSESIQKNVVVEEKTEELEPKTEVTLPPQKVEEQAVPVRTDSMRSLIVLRGAVSIERLTLPKLVVLPEDVGTFRALKISGAVDVVLKQGTSCDVRVEGNECGKEITVIKNKNGVLEIYTDTKGRSCNDCEATVYVTIVDIDRIESSGATDLQSEGILKSDRLEIISSGASDMELELDVNQLSLECSGASDLEFSGKAEMMVLASSGASEFKAVELDVKEARLDCSGASSTKVNVSNRMEVEVSGASDVRYKGRPETRQSVTGASSLRQL